MSKLDHGTIFGTASAVLSAVSAMPRSAARQDEPAPLSPAAAAVVREHYEPA